MTCVGDSIQTNYEGSADDISNMGTTAPIGQSFKVPVNTTVCGFSFYGGKGTVGTQPGTFKVEIRDAFNGTILATTGTLNSSSFADWTSPAWYKVEFTTPVALTAGTQYYLVMTALTGSTNDCMRWALDNTSPSYADGSFWSGTGAGTANTSLDCLFRIHGTTGGGPTQNSCFLPFM